MDKRKSILNISISIGCQMMTMIMAVVVKRFLIQICGNEANGLNALYTSIIGVLSVAELGVGSAITFCMYKPIVEQDDNKVSALYNLFRKIYTLVGIIILIGGLLITPFLHHLAKDFEQINTNLYISFLLMLIAVVLTYMFGAKIALINAYKNNYIATSINSGGVLLRDILQIIVLVKVRSFEAYQVCSIISVLVQWIVTDMIVQKKYSHVLANPQRIDGKTRTEVTKSIKAMFMHNIGAVLVNTVDGIVISAFVGVVSLGRYTNYTMILGAMASVVFLLFTSLTSIFGHLYAEKGKEVTRKYFELFHFFSIGIGIVFYLGYYAVIDSMVSIFFSKDLVIPNYISIVITLNGFARFLRVNTLTFRDATGVFYNDRWKPLVEGSLNLVLSVILVKELGLVGVIGATLVTNLCICHIVEPYVLYKNAFEASPRNYYLKNYAMFVVFLVSLVGLDWCMRSFSNKWIELLVNGLISVGISVFVCVIVYLKNIRSIKDMIRLVKGEKNAESTNKCNCPSL